MWWAGFLVGEIEGGDGVVDLLNGAAADVGAATTGCGAARRGRFGRG